MLSLQGFTWKLFKNLHDTRAYAKYKTISLQNEYNIQKKII